MEKSNSNPAPPVQYVTTSDGHKIAYTVEGSGRPMVMLDILSHRVFMRQNSARAAINAVLTSRFCVVAYDKRATGMSTRGLSPGHSYEDYQLDLEAVIDRVRLRQFILSA